MNGTAVLQDALLSGLAGLGATAAMSKATTAIYERQSEAIKKREQKVSSGVAYTAAAKKAARMARVELSEQAADKAGLLLHYSLGIGWVPVYLLLRRRWEMKPLGAGVTAGLSMALIIDEVANPALGTTSPPQAYPVVTHLRGLAGHLVYGLSVAAIVETGTKLLGRTRL